MKRNAFQWLKCVTSFVILIILGCTNKPVSGPDFSTYPAEREREVTNVVPIPSPVRIAVDARLSSKGSNLDERVGYSPGRGVFQFEFKTVKHGDTAEHTIFIVPRDRSEFSEEKLLARLPEGGRRECGGDFRVSRSKFFYGTEATVDMLGIRMPTLEVVYRCPVIKGPLSSTLAQIVEQAAADLDDVKYFDVSSFYLPISKAVALHALRSAAFERGLFVEREWRIGVAVAMIASRPNRGAINFLPEIVVAVVDGDNTQSEVALKHFVYKLSRHQRGVHGAKTYQPGYSRGPQPANRKVAYSAAVKFIQLVEEKSRTH